MYLYEDHMASTLQKLVIFVFGYYNLSIPLLKHFIEDPPHKYKYLVDLIYIAWYFILCLYRS